MSRVIGIDLGTTNCCLAWREDDQVVVYHDELGLSTMPSLVAQDSGGHILVGWRAKTCKDPLFRHGFAKRALGTTQQFPLQDGPVDAATISAFLLGELKTRAEAALKDKVVAVVTVPAHFQEIHREETRKAAQRAGLELIGLLPEPIAAALAWYAEGTRGEHASDEENVLIYDLGGGTMDATVCVRRGEHIEVGAFGRAYDGDKFLGGVDFDKALVGLAAGQLKSQGFELSTLGDDLPSSQWLWDLITSAERAKQDLSRDLEVQWTQELVNRGKGIQGTLNLWVTRREFESAIRHLVDRTLVFCDRALLTHVGHPGASASAEEHRAELKRAAETLARVVLVGGSTLVPCIRERVCAHFAELGAQRIEVRSFRPYECVAIGAAVYASARGTRPRQVQDGALRWASPPLERVAQEVELHPELLGSVPDAGPGWEIEITAARRSLRTPIQPDGRFRFPPFRIDPGDNQIDISVYDERGNLLVQQAQTIHRGGLSISDPGLARPISIRLVEGLRELIPAGTRPGSSSRAEFYVSDRTSKARAPLYEGHSPIGVVEFRADAEVGTPVHFRTLLKGGKLEVEVQLGTGSPERREVALESVCYMSAAPLRKSFQEIVERGEFLFSKLPKEGPLVHGLRREWEALKLDVETELANPVVQDLSRIEDRVRQLEMLALRLQAFSTTTEGLRQRLRAVRQMAVDAGSDPEILRELEAIRAAIPDREDPDTLAALDGRLQSVLRNLHLKRPPEISPGLIEYITRESRSRIESIRRDAVEKPAVLERVARIEASLEQLLGSGTDDRVMFSRLLIYEHDFIDPLYQEVVIRKSQEGLLRGTPH